VAQWSAVRLEQAQVPSVARKVPRRRLGER
jgi:hypothetical protein